MEFVSSYTSPGRILDTDIIFAIRDNEMLVQDRDGRVVAPRYRALAQAVSFQTVQYLGRLGPRHCYAGAVPKDTPPSPNARFIPVRKLFGVLDDGLFWTAVRALHIVNWDISTTFCGSCGGPIALMDEERAKACPRCDRIYYPVISPAIIAAIVKEDRLLLLNHRRSPETLYSLLAGFVEPGETLEACVARESFEEAGIRVKDVRYFGSQPWAFTGALMVGFTAAYDAGEFEWQTAEIRDGGWFRAAEIPRVNSYFSKKSECSIAWHMLKWFEETHG